MKIDTETATATILDGVKIKLTETKVGGHWVLPMSKKWKRRQVFEVQADLDVRANTIEREKQRCYEDETKKSAKVDDVGNSEKQTEESNKYVQYHECDVRRFENERSVTFEQE